LKQNGAGSDLAFLTRGTDTACSFARKPEKSAQKGGFFMKRRVAALFLGSMMAVSSIAATAAYAEETSEAESVSEPESVSDSGETGTAATAAATAIQSATSTAVSPDNDFVIAIEGSVSGLDPQNISDTNAISACSGMYETLVTFDGEGNIVGKLAESYEVSDDNLTYTFHLRQGVKFHDGTDFTAQSVIDNINRVTDKDNGLSRRRLFIVTDSDGNETNRIESMEAPDDYTLVLKLAMPYNVFLNKLTQFCIISPTALEKYGNDIMYHPCGTGPYVFSEWKQGDHTTMTANPDYWGEKPSVDTLTIQEVPEAGSRTACFRPARPIWSIRSRLTSSRQCPATIPLMSAPAIPTLCAMSP
jgi:ABC-type transport system substrate-binding protein